jgi:outer membrane protein assembly factor BamE (lipoprotein component of BamABCDE complex)
MRCGSRISAWEERFQAMKSAVFKGTVAVAGAVMLAGCMGIRDHRGAVIDKEYASAIQVGVDNKDSVAKTIGRPSFVGQFNPDDWYWVARDTKTVPLRGVGVTDQTILHIRFDAAGNVALVERTGKELIASVKPVGDKTATLGRKRGFFEELFGNLTSMSQPGLPGAGRQ